MIKTIVLSLVISFCATDLFGWGQTGHRVTGAIAERFLTKKARKELRRILGGQSLAMASTWMDEIKSDSTFDYMMEWHYINVPDGQTYEESQKNPNGDLIQTVERIVNELKAGNVPPEKEAQYVRILIHLVGDIHQPLHAGYVTDKGGNQVKVMWFRADTNLHSVWDTQMIEDTNLSYSEFAASLPLPGKDEMKGLQRSTVRDWANESIRHRKRAYEFEGGRLGYRYSYVNLPLVRERLLQAGVRLAGLLNDIYSR